MGVRQVLCSFGAYDKALESHDYWLHLSKDARQILRGVPQQILSATAGTRRTTCGLLHVDAEWACVYQFVPAKDLSAQPRPDHFAIIVASVRRNDLRDHDWRAFFGQPTFMDLASRMADGNHIQPEGLGEFSNVTLPLFQSLSARMPIDQGGEWERQDVASVCRAATSVPVTVRLHVILSDTDGSTGVRVLRLNPEKSQGFPSRKPVSDIGSSSTAAASTNRVSWLLRTLRKRPIPWAIGLSALVMLLAWAFQRVPGTLEPGQRYRVFEVHSGGLVTYICVPTQGNDAFRCDSRTWSTYTLSRRGEKRVIPSMMVSMRQITGMQAARGIEWRMVIGDGLGKLQDAMRKAAPERSPSRDRWSARAEELLATAAIARDAGDLSALSELDREAEQLVRNQP
jgi:hypothetical protein